jgi:hypothetical protein
MRRRDFIGFVIRSAALAIAEAVRLTIPKTFLSLADEGIE